MRASVHARAIAGAFLIVVLAGCRVDGGFLDEDLFACSVDRDCGEGWGCVRGSPYATDFCAPSCDAETCDGVCTTAGDVPLCLRDCRIRDDGTATECEGEGFECIRISAERDEGVCYPVSSCDSSAECAAGEICLADFVAFAPGAATDHYYCVPLDVGEGCPARSQPIDIGGSAPLCLATCNPPDSRCPPGFGCLEQAAVFSDEEVVCFPGIYGVPCSDETNCVLGSCMDTGASKQCTVTCDEAARLAGGCANLPGLASVVGALGFECDPTANGGEGGGLCVTRSSIGFVCTTPESDAYVCERGLDCRRLPSAEGEVRFCTRDCEIDQQCIDGGNRGAYCQHYARGGFCFPKGAAGAACEEDRQCLGDRCVGGRSDGDGL